MLKTIRKTAGLGRFIISTIIIITLIAIPFVMMGCVSTDDGIPALQPAVIILADIDFGALLTNEAFWVGLVAFVSALIKIWHGEYKSSKRDKIIETLVVTNQALMKHPQYSAAEDTVKQFLFEAQQEMGNHPEVHKFIKRFQNTEKAGEVVTKMTKPPYGINNI